MKAMIIASITMIPPTVPLTIGPSTKCEETADLLPLGEGTVEGVDIVVGLPAPEADGATTDGAVSFTAA